MAADAVVLAHVAFVAFVVLGGLLVFRRRWVIWLHVPSALWGVATELGGWICPLTPLENDLRARAGEAAYRGDFVEHYVLPLLYPARLTRGTQVLLGSLVLALNAFVYRRALRRPRPGSAGPEGHTHRQR